MALVVEDGTGLATADSYVSIADAVVYLDKHAASGASNVFTAAATALQETALRNAARFLDAWGALRFKGRRILGTQALQWPRYNVVTNDGYSVEFDEVPTLVINCAAELALRFVADTTGHDTSRLMPDQSAPGHVKAERIEVVDGVVSDIEYAGGSSQQKSYELCERMLAPLLEPAGRVLLA